MSIETIPHDRIQPSSLNPRRRFDQDALEELAASIAAQGILQNLVVRPTTEGYEIAAGERRWRATKLLIERGELPADHPVPCRVATLTDRDLVELAVAENTQRRDVTPIEEADGFAKLLELGAEIPDVAARFGRPERFVRQRLELHNLVLEAREALERDEISIGVAQVLTAAGEELQRAAVKAAVQQKWTVWHAQRFLRDETFPVASAIFDRALYTGTITNSLFDDEHEPAFEDVEQAQRLQLEEIERRKAAHEEEWSWVETTGYYYGYDYDELDQFPNELQEAAREKAGVVIMHSPHDHRVEEHVGVLKRADANRIRNGQPKPGGEDAEDDVDTSLTQKHVLEVHRQRSLQLQTAMRDKPGIALRLAIVGLISNSPDVLLRHDRGNGQVEALAPTLREDLAAWAERLEGHIRTQFTRGQYDYTSGPLQTTNGGTQAPAGLYRALWNFGDAELLELFTLLVASSTGSWAWGRDLDSRPVIQHAAKDAGATLPTIAELGDEYLILYRKARLIEVAREIGVEGDLEKETQTKIRALVLAHPTAQDYVPAELAFGDPPEDQQPTPVAGKAPTWLTSGSSSDKNFKSAVERATAAQLRAAIAEVQNKPGQKGRLEALSQRLRQLEPEPEAALA